MRQFHYARRAALLATAMGLMCLPPGARGASPQLAAPQTATLAFRDVTVIDVTNGERRPGQTVVIVGNRIQTIGPAETVPLPAGAQVVDARGKYLIPGLWDMRTVAASVSGSLSRHLLLSGVTGFRQVRTGYSDSSGIPDAVHRWQREILTGDRVGPPRQLYSSDLLRDAQADPAQVRRLVDSAKAAGFDMVTLGGESKALNFILAAEARRAGIRFGGQLADTTGTAALEVSDSGASLIDHGGPTSGGLDRLCVRTTQSQYQHATLATCRQAAERLRQNGTWWVPTLLQSMSREELPPSVQSQRILLAAKAEGSCNPDTWFRSLREAARFDSSGVPADSAGLLALASRAGMPLLAGTDDWPKLLHTELALMVAEGLTPLAALQTATLNPALWQHATDSLGTVAPGKLADLVLLDADPLVDITNTTTIEGVVANGRYFDRAALDQVAASPIVCSRGNDRTDTRLAGPPLAAPPAAGLAFRGVTVVDVTNGERRPDQTVVIVGNRIQTIGPAETVRPPAGVPIVDARGKYLIPGLWEMHTHMDYFYGEAALPHYIVNGVTGFRNAGWRWRAPKWMQQEVLVGTLVGPPRQLYSSNQPDGEELDSAEVRRLVDSAKAGGLDMVKTGGTSRTNYFILAAEARRVGLRFGGHLHEKTASALEASDSGVSIIDHTYLYTSGGLDRLCLRNTQHPEATLATCQQAAERLRRNDTWWVLTVVDGIHGMEPNARSRRLVGAWSECRLSSLREAARGAPAASTGVLTLAHQAGMPLLAGTDKWMSAIHLELALMVAEGLTPLAALQTATLNPARWLHATDSLGTVAPGKLADLVLLDADPLVDITNTTTIAGVVANGRYFDRAALAKIKATALSAAC